MQTKIVAILVEYETVPEFPYEGISRFTVRVDFPLEEWAKDYLKRIMNEIKDD